MLQLVQIITGISSKTQPRANMCSMLRCVLAHREYFFLIALSILIFIFFDIILSLLSTVTPTLRGCACGLCAPEGLGLALWTLFARLFGPSQSASPRTILLLILV